MTKPLILLVFIFYVVSLSAQEVEWYVTGLPVREGIIYKPIKHSPFNYHNASDGVYISSSSDTCFSLVDGKIVSKFELSATDSAIVIRSGDLFFAFSNLKKLFLNVGDVIKSGERIGVISQEDEAFELYFSIADSNSRFLPYYKFLFPFLTKECFLSSPRKF